MQWPSDSVEGNTRYLMVMRSWVITFITFELSPFTVAHGLWNVGLRAGLASHAAAGALQRHSAPPSERPRAARRKIHHCQRSARRVNPRLPAKKNKNSEANCPRFRAQQQPQTKQKKKKGLFHWNDTVDLSEIFSNAVIKHFPNSESSHPVLCKHPRTQTRKNRR